jgi:hypothetical protein
MEYKNRPIDTCRGCRQTRQIVDVVNRLCRACYMANYRHAKDGAEQFIDPAALNRARMKRLEKAITKCHLILVRWLADLKTLEEGEIFNATQVATVCGFIQPEIERLSQELKLRAEPVLAALQEEADNDELEELDDKNFIGEFGPPPPPDKKDCEDGGAGGEGGSGLP